MGTTRWRHLAVGAAAVAALLGPAAAAQATTTLHVVDLGTLRGACCSQAQAINVNNVVVGQSSAVGGDHAFRWQNGHMTDLGTLGGANSDALAINDFGVIAGFSDNASGNTHAVIWVNGRIRDLGTLGGPTSVATGINNNGAVVGQTALSDGTFVGFVWRNGVMSKLATTPDAELMPNAINNNGQVAVTVRTATNDMPGRWFGGSTELCTSDFGHGNAINIHGDVAGDFVSGPQQAFVFHNHTFIPLPTPAGADLASAAGINASRVSVGFVITTTNLSKPVRWPAFGAATTLPTLAGGTAGTGAANGINGAGMIVGWTSTTAAGGDAHAVLWTS